MYGLGCRNFRSKASSARLFVFFLAIIMVPLNVLQKKGTRDVIRAARSSDGLILFREGV